MSIQLPEPIETYLLSSESGDLEKAAAAFAPDATVVDEGEDAKAVGREAIYHWMADYTSKYKTTLEVTEMVEKEGEVVLTALVSGNFDGSPAEFVYRFVLRDGLIGRMVVEFVGFK
jgi:ketosteroid isomerase-like protein